MFDKVYLKLNKGPVKSIQWVKIVHSFLQSVSKSVPLYHFNLAFVVLHMIVKNLQKPTSKNGEIGRFNLESFLTSLENQLQCTAEFVSKALKDLFLF